MYRVLLAASLAGVAYLQTNDEHAEKVIAMFVQNTKAAVVNGDSEYFYGGIDEINKITISALEWSSAEAARRSEASKAIIAAMVSRKPEYEPPAKPKPVIKPEPKQVAAKPVDQTHKLGKLSEKYESNGNPGAYGFDRTGGPSYGSYQIATYTGTYKKWMRWLKRNEPKYYRELQSVGGYSAARKGRKAVKQKWRQLAKQKGFEAAQHGFIADTHYVLLARDLKKINIHLDKRSHALRDVAWSVAVQLGPHTNIFKRCRKSSATDRKLINCVYSIRHKYFKSSTAAVKRSVKKRFKLEQKRALRMLESE